MNKFMVTINIVAYLLIIITDFITSYIPVHDERDYLISNISFIAAISVSSLIVGLVVN